MKKSIIFFLLMLLFLTTGNLSAQQIPLKSAPSNDFQLQKLKFTVSDSWFGRDKMHHFLTSAFLSTAGYYYGKEVSKYSNLKSQQIGFSFSISLGLLKEFKDGTKQGNAFSWKDLVADVLGTAAGLAIIAD